MTEERHFHKRIRELILSFDTPRDLAWWLYNCYHAQFPAERGLIFRRHEYDLEVLVADNKVALVAEAKAAGLVTPQNLQDLLERAAMGDHPAMINELLRGMGADAHVPRFGVLLIAVAHKSGMPVIEPLYRDLTLDTSEMAKLVAAAAEAGHTDLLAALPGNYDFTREQSRAVLDALCRNRWTPSPLLVDLLLRKFRLKLRGAEQHEAMLLATVGLIPDLRDALAFVAGTRHEAELRGYPYLAALRRAYPERSDVPHVWHDFPPFNLARMAAYLDRQLAAYADLLVTYERLTNPAAVEQIAAQADIYSEVPVADLRAFAALARTYRGSRSASSSRGARADS